MDKYIGTKVIEAEPMTRGEFNRTKGVEIPMEDPGFSEVGYMVIYPDGYVSWSPKAAFDHAYSKVGENPLADTALLMRSPDYKDRFRAEYQQLSIRCEKLGEMIKKYENGTLGFTPDCPMELLRDQHYMMGYYREALEERAEYEGIAL